MSIFGARRVQHSRQIRELRRFGGVVVVCLFGLTMCGVGYCYFADSETAQVTIETGSWHCGCSHGYWKNHLEEWDITGYDPYEPLQDVFEPLVFDDNPTLLEALRLPGGPEAALAREAVAALLNAAHPEVEFGLTEEQVIAVVEEAFHTGDYEAAKNRLEEYNTGCGECPL